MAQFKCTISMGGKLTGGFSSTEVLGDDIIDIVRGAFAIGHEVADYLFFKSEDGQVELVVYVEFRRAILYATGGGKYCACFGEPECVSPSLEDAIKAYKYIRGYDDKIVTDIFRTEETMCDDGDICNGRSTFVTNFDYDMRDIISFEVGVKYPLGRLRLDCEDEFYEHFDNRIKNVGAILKSEISVVTLVITENIDDYTFDALIDGFKTLVENPAIE